MNRSIVFRIVMALILIAALVGIGLYAYNAGIARGVAQNIQVQTGNPPTTTIPYYAYPYGPHFFWWGGFGILGCLIPLFLIFLAFSALRGLMWFGPRRWHHFRHGQWGVPPESGQGDWHEGVPPMFDEWHRRSHQKPDTESTNKA